MDTKVLTKVMGLTGTILPYGLVSAPDPDFALLCDGSALLAGTADRLRQALIDDSFPWGDDGSGNPLLPPAAGRMLVGAGTGAGLTARSVGDTGGEESHQLTESEMPSHSHDHSLPPSWGSNQGTVGNIGWSQDNGVGSAVNKPTASAGSGQAHNNMPPFLVTNFIILT